MDFGLFFDLLCWSINEILKCIFIKLPLFIFRLEVCKGKFVECWESKGIWIFMVLNELFQSMIKLCCFFIISTNVINGSQSCCNSFVLLGEWFFLLKIFQKCNSIFSCIINSLPGTFAKLSFSILKWLIWSMFLSNFLTKSV